MFMNTYFSENGYEGRGYIMKKKIGQSLCHESNESKRCIN